MATSALAYGFELNILGKKRQDQWNIYSYLDKLWALREFLELLRDDPKAIVVFADAYDVIFIDTPKSLVKRFIRTGKNVLVSAEKGCCSDWLMTVEAVLKREPLRCDNTWPLPSVDGPMMYLNSGLFVGFQVVIC
jgi:hypothetical protein